MTQPSSLDLIQELDQITTFQPVDHEKAVGIIARLDASNDLAWSSLKIQKGNEIKNRGNELMAKGDNEGAEALFGLCTVLEPKNHVYWSNRSAARCNLGKYQLAIEDADKVIQLNPQWARGYGRKATACFFLKRYDDSLEAYKNGLKIEPNNESFLSGLAQVEKKVKAQNLNERAEEFIAKNKLNEAVKYLNEAIELDPNEVSFWGNRYDAYMGLKDYAKALEDADQGIRLKPEWAKGYQRRAEALTKLDRYDDAAAAYAAYLRIDPNSEFAKKELSYVVQEGTRYRQRKEMEQKVAKK